MTSLREQVEQLLRGKPDATIGPATRADIPWDGFTIEADEEQLVVRCAWADGPDPAVDAALEACLEALLDGGFEVERVQDQSGGHLLVRRPS